MTKLLAVAKRFGLLKEEGATMVEYALMLAFIALVCFSAIQSLGVSVKGIFPSVSASL
ncbi:MAG TPA: Flp family type IVb pilin [Isosphaeraceae bacterium]|jgi:Flp pilus assembly pilin Flp|nr:Flp family type IVb pilin [Isosphaeraceae bacterium]